MNSVIAKYNLLQNARAAEQRIRKYIRTTHLDYSPFLSQLGNCDVYLKLENQQISGSFKYRGAANFILSLSEEEIEKGLITASTGNHASAVAVFLKHIGRKGTIYLPENITKAKMNGLGSDNVELVFYGQDIADTEMHARKVAEEKGCIYIPPYNHLNIISGQATIAVELEQQLENINSVFIPVGGGGLASGIAGYMKARNKAIQIIGCQPHHSPIMYESVKASTIISMGSLATLADGSAGGIEEDSLTFEICKELVDDFILVSEDEIKEAVILMLKHHHMLIEGAAALSVASFIKRHQQFRHRNVVLIITGSKIGLTTLKNILL
ncbi:MAG: threonine/serine dehydratase [FCB group bacterium]|nr:threonine/serine dehydratase [FCB group bacterium]